jgi:hypothetical protein
MLIFRGVMADIQKKVLYCIVYIVCNLISATKYIYTAKCK